MSETKNKKWNELRKPFPENLVKKKPGGFGSYVPHYVYTRRLVNSGMFESFDTLEVVRGQAGHVIGARCKLVVDGVSVVHTGDVELPAISMFLNGKKSEGELIKDAESDALKRCCMRLGIGLELWEQGLMEDTTEPVAEKKTAAPVKTGTSPSKKVEPKLEESSTQKNSDELNEILSAMCPDEKVRKEIKKTAYNKTQQDGFDKDVNNWSEDQMKTFLEYFADLYKSDTALLDSMTTDISDVEMQCSEANCGKFQWIVDNRVKKAEAPDGSKLANIPDFSCDNWGDAEGCGKGWYIGSKDFPFDKWL